MPSIGTMISQSYFGPSPSKIAPALVGPVQLLKSGTLDLMACTITLPLYKGYMAANAPSHPGAIVWYILTDTNDQGTADLLGLDYSAKLNYANVGGATRSATLGANDTMIFDRGTVDFSPVRVVVPGPAPNFFPPTTATPGSVGDQFYSPLVTVKNQPGLILNAPIVAFDVSDTQLNQFCNGNPDYSLVLDQVVRICPKNDTVTMKLSPAFSFAKPVLYLSSTESNNAVIAAIEGATYAPLLKVIPTGFDDGAFSATERLFAVINGPTGVNNPQRQGLDSALSDGSGISPLNVLGGIPTVAFDYSPLWDIQPVVWTQAAVTDGYRARVIDEFQILGLVEEGWITGPGGVPFGTAGIVNNCPIVFRFL